MKNLAKLVGIIVMVALIGFTMAACNNDPDDGGKDALDGTTWRSSNTNDEGTTITIDIIFSSQNFTLKTESYSLTGTYSISGNTVTLNVIMNGQTDARTGTLSGNTLTIQGQVFTKQ